MLWFIHHTGLGAITAAKAAIATRKSRRHHLCNLIEIIAGRL